MVNVGASKWQALVFLQMCILLRSLRHEVFDCVHATTWRAALPGLLFRRKVPLVVTIHGREVFIIPAALKPLFRIVLRHALLLPVVSNAIKERAKATLGRNYNKAFVNWNGISFSASEHEPKPAGRLEILSVCRLIKRKNLANALRATARLRDAGTPFYYRIAGSGPEQEELADLIRKLGLHDCVEMLGRVDDAALIKLYQRSHVFLHPQVATSNGNDLEGFGLTIVDSMSFACVPIAGASGGPLDFIDDGLTGILVDGRHVTEIETALTSLADSEEYRSSVATAAQAFVRRDATWQAHAARILERVPRASEEHPA